MGLRTALVVMLSAAGAVTAAVATEAPRAAGAYVSLTTRDAAACARACADDGICMAWSFQRDNQCQLSAVVAAQPDPTAIETGYASRAPEFLRARTPVLHAATVIQPQPVSPPPAPARVASTMTADVGELLGGPDEGDLRLR